MEEISEEAYKDCFWVKGPCKDKEEGTRTMHFLGNLNKDIGKHVHSQPQKREGIYEELWNKAIKDTDPKSMKQLGSSAYTEGEKRMALKLRNGCQWSTKKAHHLRMPVRHKYSGHSKSIHPCPLCGGEDGGTHMACSCTHPDIKGSFIKRHDDVVRVLAKEIEKSNNFNILGNRGYLIVDAKEEKGLEKEGGIPKRIPEWVLPNVAQDTRNKMRPDIMHISGVSEDPEAEDIEDIKARAKISIIEVGFTMDYNYAQKKKEKEEQHSILREELTKEGWKVEWQRNFIVGVGGVLFKDNRTFLEKDMGLEMEEVNRVMKKIQSIAIKGTHQAIRTRRHLEHSPPQRGGEDRNMVGPRVGGQLTGSPWDRG
jgi:hypothetical protein